MRTIKQILMDRDGMDAAAADDLISEAKEQLNRYLERNDFCAADDICAEYFGLEPDYVFELIPF